MKPYWLITLCLTLLLAMACSKEEEATEDVPDTSEPTAPPAENTEPTTPSEPENTETNSEPSNASTNATSFPIPNPTANLPAGPGGRGESSGRAAGTGPRSSPPRPTSSWW